VPELTAPTFRMSYAWAMPSPRTFTVKPIRDFVGRYLATSECSLDPFAGDGLMATHRNDVNPDTAAEHHLDVADFLALMESQRVRPDLVIWDPPYTYHQLRQCYGGGKLTQAEAQRFGIWPREKDIVARLQPVGGVFLHFGHHTNGMGLKRGYEREERLVVCHGRAHHDTLCLAERKVTVSEASAQEARQHARVEALGDMASAALGGQVHQPRGPVRRSVHEGPASRQCP